MDRFGRGGRAARSARWIAVLAAAVVVALAGVEMSRGPVIAAKARVVTTSAFPIAVADRRIARSTLSGYDRIYGGGAAQGWIRRAWIDAESARRGITASQAEVEAELQRMHAVSQEDDLAVARIRVLAPKLLRALRPARSDRSFAQAVNAVHARWRRVTSCTRQWTAPGFCGNRPTRSRGETCRFAGFIDICRVAAPDGWVRWKIGLAPHTLFRTQSARGAERLLRRALPGDVERRADLSSDDDYIYSYSRSADNALSVARRITVLALERGGVPDN